MLLQLEDLTIGEDEDEGMVMLGATAFRAPAARGPSGTGFDRDVGQFTSEQARALRSEKIYYSKIFTVHVELSKDVTADV
jgi:hypothetical protein